MPLLSPDEPPPVEVFQEHARSPFVIVCDHAGRELPRALGTLGLTPADLQSHIAWDLGAADTAKRLAVELGAPLFLQTYSRLVIDCNRPLSAPDSIPAQSGGLEIWGNHGLSEAERQARAAEIFEPYQRRISDLLDRRSQPFLLLALHSFTPEFEGVVRPFHAGVLYHRDQRLAKPLLALLQAEPGLVVGENEPYAATAATDYAVIEHAERRGAAYVELEVRQDLVADDAGQRLWAERLARLLQLASAAMAH